MTKTLRRLNRVALDIAMISRYLIVGNTHTRKVWLTFDDGPHPIYTPMVLDTLRQHRVRVTFFLLAQRAEQYPEAVRRIVDDGHQVGSHSYSHPKLTTLSADALRAEIERADAVLSPYMGSTKLFRPPYGDYNAMVIRTLAEYGYQMVLWNVNTLDWHPRFQPDRWVRIGTFMVRVGGESTVLLHDTMPGTAENLDRFLRNLEDMGSNRFVEEAASARRGARA